MRALESKDFMMAEYLPGREFAFQSLWSQGELVASQARERLEYVFGNLSPSGQSSSPSVAVTVSDPRVNEIAHRAVLAIDEKPHGVFCVDLKENEEADPCVTEINVGRFFTTSNFFARLGCNMPHLMVKLAFGESIPPQPRFNAVPPGYLWIRLMDAGPVLLRQGEWRSVDA
jgi:carbamoyl-phosphate synthase large subunit